MNAIVPAIRLDQLSGISGAVADRIAEDAGLDVDVVYGVYVWMHTYGLYSATSALMASAFPLRGWSRTSTYTKIKEGLRKIALIKDAWISGAPGSPAREHDFDTRDFFADEVALGQAPVLAAMDTVPIVAYARLGGMYQPKYAANVLKVLVVTALNGFVIFVSDCVYTGSSGDAAIQAHSGVGALFRQWNMTVLADGAFNTKNGQNVIKPARKGNIWPKRLKADQTVADYRAKADLELQYNEKIAHFRSRVEHTFAAPMMGRFNILKRFRSQPHLAWFCTVAALIALNIDIFMNHVGGRYAPITDAMRTAWWTKIDAHAQQSRRYPQPRDRPLPPLGRRRPRPGEGGGGDDNDGDDDGDDEDEEEEEEEEEDDDPGQRARQPVRRPVYGPMDRFVVRVPRRGAADGAAAAAVAAAPQGDEDLELLLPARHDPDGDNDHGLHPNLDGDDERHPEQPRQPIARLERFEAPPRAARGAWARFNGPRRAHAGRPQNREVAQLEANAMVDAGVMRRLDAYFVRPEINAAMREGRDFEAEDDASNSQRGARGM